MADTIMVAYSFNEDNPLNVPKELRAITELVQQTKCKIDPLPKANQFQLENRFMLLKQDILIFHFAGHAGNASIELNDGFSEEMFFTDMKVFSEIIAADATALRLVFLNGCSTKDQSEYLRSQKVPAVISTTLPLDDIYALRFAHLFYSRFFNRELNLSLQSAFEKTLRSFKAKDETTLFTEDNELKNPNLLHPKMRGNFKVTQDTPREIYQLDGDEAVLKQTFADWQAQGVAQPPQATDLNRTKPANLGISDDTYLLCDRSLQVNTFQQLIKTKAKGELPEPSFIFINCHSSDCLPELLLRFKRFDLPQYCPGGFLLESLEFPDAEFFDIPGDPRKPLAFLDEIFKELTGKKAEQKFGNETLLVLCHKIYTPFWKEGLKPLFEYYLGDCSKNIQQQLSERLIIFFVLIHTGEPAETSALAKYQELYEYLKNNYPQKVAFFNSLPLIKKGDLLKWHGDVYETSISTDKLPVKQEGIYYLEAIELMKGIIAERKRNA